MHANCRPSKGYKPGAVIAGAVLLVLGGTMFLERSGLADVSFGRIVAPAILIILGTLSLLEQGGIVHARQRAGEDPEVTRGRKRDALSGGVWLLGLGCWMLVSQLHLFGLDYRTSWPLLIILSGTIMLARGLR